jgi:hypothetical protein
MTLWALRGVVLGKGAWLTVSHKKNLQRLENSPRQRKPASLPEWK